MWAYRLVSVKFQLFGLQTRIERLLDSVEHGLYLRLHKGIFALIDEWFGLSMEQIREQEEQLKNHLDQVCFCNRLFLCAN